MPLNGVRRCSDAPDDDTCADCPLGYLEKHAQGESQLLISRAEDLAFALQQGLTVTPQDIDLVVYKALRVLQEERDRFSQEEQQNAQSSHSNIDQRRHGIG